MEEYFYKNEDGETLKVSCNYKTTPPKEITYNSKKFYLI